MLSNSWSDFCRRGGYPRKMQEASVARCADMNGNVRGYYSDFLLNPELPHTNAMYPSHDHLAGRGSHSQMVVDTRVINDMKSILSEDELWRLVEHLYSVGCAKGRIPQRKAERHDDWTPTRDYA